MRPLTCNGIRVMDYFAYQQDRLYAEQVPLDVIAERYGTPCYVYSRATIERHWHAFDRAFGDHPHQVCYAVKANSNLAILNLLAGLGSGFDIVSVGELERVIAAGGDPARTVFSGVAKTHAEIQRALTLGIGCFNVESVSELERINDIAGSLAVPAPVSLRVNPDVDAQTHPYISTGLKENKFGIAIAEAESVYQRAAGLDHIRVVGVDCHIGSQLTSTGPFVAAAERLLLLIERLGKLGIQLDHIDVGGGLGVCYNTETPPLPDAYVGDILAVLGGDRHRILIEPGRAIVANAGVLLTRVEYLKQGMDRHFAIVDAGMNDLLRPALYDAWQAIVPLEIRHNAIERVYDIVGPVCETGDFLGKGRSLAIAEGDLLAVRSAGAYGFTMSSNYNSRPRAAEVLVDGERLHLIRERETVASLFAGEHIVEDLGLGT